MLIYTRKITETFLYGSIKTKSFFTESEKYNRTQSETSNRRMEKEENLNLSTETQIFRNLKYRDNTLKKVKILKLQQNENCIKKMMYSISGFLQT